MKPSDCVRMCLSPLSLLTIRRKTGASAPVSFPAHEQLSRKWALIARPAVHHCALLHICGHPRIGCPIADGEFHRNAGHCRSYPRGRDPGPCRSPRSPRSPRRAQERKPAQAQRDREHRRLDERQGKMTPPQLSVVTAPRFKTPSIMRSSAMVNSMILVTVTGDHDRPDWMITFTGIRRHCAGPRRQASEGWRARRKRSIGRRGLS